MRPGRLLALLLAVALPAEAARFTVLDHGAWPIEGAVVRWDGGEAAADAEGWVTLPDGIVPACATAPGYTPVALGPEFLTRAMALQPPGFGAVTLQRAGALQGAITSPDGAPAPGVALRVAGDEALGPCARSVVSRADGTYRLDGLSAWGDTRVEVVTSDACLPARVGLMVPPTNETLLRRDIVVLPAVRIALSVKGADGKPLPGASVRMPAQWDRLGLAVRPDAAIVKAIDAFEGTTDPNGAVTLPVLPRAAGWRLVVRHPQHAAASVTLDLRTGAPSPVLALQRGGTLVMRGLDEAGAPRPGLTARLTSSTAKDADLVAAPTPAGADGVLRVEHVPAARYEAELRAPGARPKLVRGLVVKDGAVADAGDVVLDPGVALRGVVLGDGSPLQGAKVTLWTMAEGARLRLETTSGADGAFVFEGLDPEEAADVRATAEGFVAGRLNDIATGTSDAAIELQRAATLVAIVRDAQSHDALTDVEIELTPSNGAGAEPENDEARPEEWTVAGLSAGDVDVLARAPGYAPETRRGVTLVAGETTRVAFDLATGAVVEGRVVAEETGAGVVGATVAVPQQGVSATSRVDGSFTLDGVRVPFDVKVSHDAFVTARLSGIEPEKLPEGGLVVTLPRGGSVEGTVFGADGAPLPGAQVKDGEGGRSAVSDPEGRYRLDGLPPGPRSLQKVDRPGTFDGLESASVDIVKGGVVKHDFGGGLRIMGVVTQHGEPVRGVQIGALGIDRSDDPVAGLAQNVSAATSGADGRYAIAVSKAGEYCLTVSWRERRFGRIVNVAGGAVTEDIAIPDMHVSGRVVDAETREPLRGAYVSLTPLTGDDGGKTSIGMSESDSEGNQSDLTVWSSPESACRAAADGSFSVLVDRPGPCSFTAWMQGYEYWKAPEGFAVTETREDVVIEMKKTAEKHDLKVHLVDAATGSPVSGTSIVMTINAATGEAGSVNIMGGGTSGQGPAPGEGETATVLGRCDGRGVAVRAGIRPTGDDITVDLPLSPGGSVRVLAPEGALQPDRMRGFTGPLSVKIPPGFELGEGNLNVQMNVTSKLVGQEAPGAWIFRDLPAGPVTFTLGDGTPKTVDVVAGETVEADLR